MKSLRWINLIVIFALLSACSFSSDGIGFASIFSTPTPLATPAMKITSAPDAEAPIRAYLEAYKSEDYAAMYAMTTQVSRDGISVEDFAALHNDALDKMGTVNLDYEILSVLVNSPYAAQAAFRLTYRTALLGDISRDMVANLSLEDGDWKLQWQESLILPELAGGKRLAMDYQIPARGDIYDRDGEVLVNQSSAYALGIIPNQVSDEFLGTLVSELARICIVDPQNIWDEIEVSAPAWYIPLCEGTEDQAERALNLGAIYTPYESRFYHQNLASQTVGYTLPIDPTQLDEYLRKGYRGDEKVGQAGIEKWAEDYLSGEHGGSLYVVDPTTGQVSYRIGSVDPQPADSIYLTIDSNLQYYAQQALIDFRGAAVVMELDTGRILAMASSPGFDANLFELTNYNNSLLGDMLNDLNQPLVNRATQGQYPLGSVFKIITFSAALESGLFLPESTLDCQYEWRGLNDQVRYDWTWDHCQDEIAEGGECDESSTLPSGLLTLPEGLMRSCNPWFWQIGLDLYNFERGGDIANMARAFGLGVPTGIDQVAEASGQINEPPGLVEAVNQAIGQGDVLVTPLQVAVMIAAVGNGGTLYRPQLVERIQPIEGGDPTVVFKPEARGTLPLRKDNLEVLQNALISVVQNPLGTAHFALRGLNIPVAGKTGTAESGSGDPHAWFAGYTYADEESTSLPNIAIVVVLENAGEGSEYAAPIFRRMVDVYYTGGPRALLPWEANYGIHKTPTPLGGIPTNTPRNGND